MNDDMHDVFCHPHLEFLVDKFIYPRKLGASLLFHAGKMLLPVL